MTSKVWLQHRLNKVLFFSLISLLVFLLITVICVLFGAHELARGSTAKQRFAVGNVIRHSSISVEDSVRENSKSDATFKSELEVDNQQELILPLKITQKISNNESFDHESESIMEYSGNFRDSEVSYWDVSPEYVFDAFGRKFHLILSLDSTFVHPNLTVTRMWKNDSTEYKPNINPEGCFYSGFLKDEPSSKVVVSLCNGITGHIKSVSGSYSIQPVETSDTSGTFHHILKQINFKSATSSASGKYCASPEDSKTSINKSVDYTAYEMDDDDYLISNNSIPFKSTHRRKRSVDEYTIELMIAVDKKLFNLHGSRLENYILSLINTVKHIFKDSSIGNPINVAVVHITKLEDEDEIREERDRKGNNVVILERFCEWQWKNNKHDDNHPLHHDTAVYITKDEICTHGHQNCGNFLGFAQIGNVCHNLSYGGCAVVRDNGFNTAFTIAHEIGHVLNMQHDDHPSCAQFRNEGEKERVMTRTLDIDTDHWTWSACSRHALTEFLQTANVECLHDNTIRPEERTPVADLPGKDYSIDKQCEAAHGVGWKKCPIVGGSAEPPCTILSCYKPDEINGCINIGGWADGTPCGVNQWCRHRKCVSKSHEGAVIHGGWGEWQPYSECSRSCGGGVKRSYRYCDNPKNANGGNYCRGPAVNYQSCNIQECPSGTPDIRAEQCSKYNNLTTEWMPSGEFSQQYKCKLVCKDSHTMKSTVLSNKIIDGAPCEPNSVYDICVNGKCMKAGCDHILNSDTKLDICGVCNGDNSTCDLIKGTINEQFDAGYNHILTIPAGAYNLDIQQFSSDGLKDRNYIALRDIRRNEYILNGKYSVTRYNKKLTFHGIFFEYSSESNPERVRSFNRLESDIALEILAGISNSPPFKVIYQYFLPKTFISKYEWKITDEWTRCNKVCSGEQEKVFNCVSKQTNNIVPAELCASLKKPRSQTRDCNSDCVMRWKVFNETECSSRCGPGIQKLTYRCYQVFRSSYTPHPFSDVFCSHIEKPAEERACTGRCDKVRWNYSNWSPCSVTCGTGVQRRTAECVDELDKKVDDSVCSSIEKITETLCTMDRCPSWFVNQRSACSVTCGTGVRKQDIFCEQNNRIVSLDLCPQELKPREFEVCQMPACPTWIVGEWSKCSVTCGNGTVVRTVKCSDPNENLCPLNLRPSETENCSLHPCQLETNNIPKLFHVSKTLANTYQWRMATWNECSAKCGKGMKQRLVECYDHDSSYAVPDELCSSHKKPPETEPCEEHTFGKWRTSEWSSCSTTCGPGRLMRKVWCEVKGKLALDIECCEPKPASIVPCELISCPSTLETTLESFTTSAPSSWRVGLWQQCSVTCGGGTKNRTVLCLDNKGVSSAFCSEHERPASSSPCNTQSCPNKIEWKYGDWSQCNQTCDGGYQHRQAQCVSKIGENLPESECNRYERPQLLRKCENNPCQKVSYQWKSSMWNECSVSCGIGVYTRSVQCYKVDEYQIHNMEIVDDSYCSADRPVSEKMCQKEPCRSATYMFRWRPGPWSECSVSCGSGIQKRSVNCEKVNEQRPENREIVSESYCVEETRPLLRQECQQSPCPDRYHWETGPWGECVGPCGNKRKKRKLYCYRNDQNVKYSACRHLSKPKRRRKCPREKCEPTNCLDIKLMNKIEQDGEYVINILGRSITIWCHDMQSSQPKEYLSLALKSSENYSEYYSRKLKDLNSCITASRSRQTRLFDYLRQDINNIYYGKTVFTKLRLNVTTLHVLTNDYQFAHSMGYSVPAGESGDCHSKQFCHQGSFSIDVSGTGLRVASSAKWEKIGFYVNMDIRFFHERRKVTGKCGGFCGTCKPINGLKLDVLPP